MSVRVLDAWGRVVTAFPTQRLSGGVHDFLRGRNDDHGSPAPAGVYVAEVRDRNERASARFIVLD